MKKELQITTKIHFENKTNKSYFTHTQFLKHVINVTRFSLQNKYFSHTNFAFSVATHVLGIYIYIYYTVVNFYVIKALL